MVHAEPNVGKSLLSMDWALSLAAGWAWIGNKSVQGKVLYLTSEGKTGLRGRVDAWRQSREAEYVSENVGWVLDSLLLGTQADGMDRARLLEVVRRVEPRLVVIDPLVDYFSPGDENNAQDMQGFVSYLKEFIELGATVVVNHHQTKATKDLRGSGALRGSADMVFKMTPKWKRATDDDPDPPLESVVLSTQKVKDGARPDVLRFELQEFQVPTKKGTSVALRLKKGLSLAEKAPTQTVLITILEQNLGEMPREDLRSEFARRGQSAESFRGTVAKAIKAGRVREEDGIISLVGNNDSPESVEDDRKEE